MSDWDPPRRFSWVTPTMVEPATSHRDDYASRLRRARAIGKAIRWAKRASRGHVNVNGDTKKAS